MFINFCERNRLIVTDTWFRKPKRRLYTWKTTGDGSRHQLGYILVKYRFRNNVKDVQTQPGQILTLTTTYLLPRSATV
jgi:hypothetical protein